MTTKNTKTNTTTAAAQRLDQARATHQTAKAKEADARAAVAAAEKTRSAGHSIPSEVKYPHLLATIAVHEAEDALQVALDDARRAGVAGPEETTPGGWNVSGLTETLSPIALEILDLEERIETAKQRAAQVIAQEKVARDAEAAKRTSDHPFGAPPPVPSRIFDVLLEVARQSRAGTSKPAAIASAAGWHNSMGGGDVPAGLAGVALVEAALAGAKPRGPRYTERVRQLRMEAASIERHVAEEARKDAERKVAREEFQRAKAAEQKRQQEADRARHEAWVAECEKQRAEDDRAREEGRRLLTGS